MGASTRSLPVLPLRRAVLLPLGAMPIAVGRAKTERAVEAAFDQPDKKVLVLGVDNLDTEDAGPDDVRRVGTIASVNRMLHLPDGTMSVLVTGVERAIVQSFTDNPKYLEARVREWPLDTRGDPTELEALARAVTSLAQQVIELLDTKSEIDIAALVGSSSDVPRVVYTLGSLFNLAPEQLQAVLEAPTARAALERLQTNLAHEVAVLEVKHRIARRTATEISEQQRQAILRQQLHAIQEELGETEGEPDDVARLEARLAEVDLPDAVRDEVNKELGRLRRLPSAAQEWHVILSRVELVLDLPWSVQSGPEIDIVAARAVLEEDHHGLEEVKERILEHLAVLHRNPETKAPILCFVGPPGVGKTSVGQSIARALGRRFSRMSLGGVHDEAELRGHRRTYVGAMPGRIIRAIKLAGTRNPVLMLDEVDKLGHDFRGDPAAALLEVLDPEQNDAFHDNYLDLPFDLSKVFFITTCNTLETVPRPLLDRMEILRLPGYTEEDKLVIARRFLVPRQLERAGLEEGAIVFDEATLRALVARYTREAGVRQLEQRIGSLARKVALHLTEGRDEPELSPSSLADLLGPPPYAREQWRASLPPGVAAGLAWTEAGGDVLYVEAATLPPGRGLLLTGQLGDVMKESAQAASSYLWTRADDFGLDVERMEKSGLHVHVPAGATPKDGPSAGITMCAAVASLFAGRAIRADTAMTGEITLTGLVLPVGGIREKVLAASRLGLRRVVIPADNAADLEKVPAEVKAVLEILLVRTVDEALSVAFAEPPPALVHPRPTSKILPAPGPSASIS